MRKFIRYILLFPIFALVVVLAIANRTPVSFSFNPFNPNHPNFTFFDIPLFILLFCFLLIGILLGGIGTWFKQGKIRRKAKMNQNEIARMRRESDQFDDSRQVLNNYILPTPKNTKAN